MRLPLSREAAVAVGVALAAVLLAATPLLRLLEWRLYDMRVRWNVQQVTSRVPITIIAIDDDSLRRLEPTIGRWPWPRGLFAPVVDYASAARVIGLDILLSETDRSYHISDAVLAEEAAEHGGVVAAVFLDGSTGKVVEPYPALAAAVAAIGHVHVYPDPDGVVRRHMSELNLGDHPVPSFASTVAALYRGGNALPMPSGGSSFLLLPSRERPPVYSIVDVMAAWREESEGRTPALSREVFRDRIVLLGSLATGLPLDREVTSYSESEAGVLITATAIQNILEQRAYRVLPAPAIAVLVALLAFVPLVIRTGKPVGFLGQAVLLFAGYVLVTIAVGIWSRWMLPLATPALAWLCTTTGCLVIHWDDDRKHRIRLQQLEQAKQRFTDMLVHDLRNRLTVTQLVSDILAPDLREAQPETARMLDLAGASLKRMLVEVNSLLDIRKMEEGRLALHLESIDLPALLTEVARDYQTAAEVSAVSLQVKIDPAADRELSGDRVLLSRLLGNLVFNALQYVRAGTEVVLSTTAGAGTVRISVANSGPVLTEDQRAWLFQPFQSLAASASKRGTGLGLTMCKLVAEAHGGSIDIESPWPVSGDGVVVHIQLPCYVANELKSGKLHKVKENA